MVPANTDQKKTILISYKADFRVGKIISDKEGHYLMIKWLILQEYIKILYTYQSAKMQDTKTANTARRNWQIHYYCLRL